VEFAWAAHNNNSHTKLRNFWCAPPNATLTAAKERWWVVRSLSAG
jgi:hypothetical protein